MGEYKFYQDRKVTSWERDYFSVKADSYEEAEAIVRTSLTTVFAMKSGKH